MFVTIFNISLFTLKYFNNKKYSEIRADNTNLKMTLYILAITYKLLINGQRVKQPFSVNK